MKILEQTTDMAGKIRMTCQTSTGESMFLKFSTQPSQEQLEEIEARHIEITEESDVEAMTNLLNEESTILMVVRKLRNNPAITIVQFNTWLNDFSWQDQNIAWNFLMRLRAWLSSRSETTFSDDTQGETMRRCRSWIVNTRKKRVTKIVFGSLNISLIE